MVAQSAQTFTILREIARAINVAWDLDSTLDLIVRKTTEMMRVDTCNIYLLDPNGRLLRLRATTGLSPRALGRATLPMGEGMTGVAAIQKRPLFAAEAQLDPHFKWVEHTKEHGFKSLLAVPLLIGEKPIGAMNVQTVHLHHYSDDEVEILSLIGDLAAGALARAQLHDEQSRQITEMQAVAQVSEAITSPQYLDDILRVVMELATKTMQATVCSIFLLDESGTQLEMRAAQNTTSPYRPRRPIPVGHGVVGTVAQTGQLIYVNDVQNDERYKGTEQARVEGLVSLLSVPLTVQERVIGVLNCYSAEQRRFTDEQITLFSTLANQTALAIENARLATNTAVIREMHHRIKNNLQTVAMLMQLQLMDAERLTTTQVLETNIYRVRSIAAVHEVLSERSFRFVDVKDVLQRLMATTTDTMTVPQQNITIEVIGESLPLPSRSATALTLVVNELVQNSLEHGFRGRKIGTITISLGHSPEELIVLVRDDGVGLPLTIERGLGLEITHTLVGEDLRGRLKFNRPAAGGAEVSIRMPRSLEQELA
ncbi:MAG: GAF domain-containing protein [Chloroflexota bacterium]